MSDAWARARARDLAVKAGEAPPVWAKESHWWETHDEIVALVRWMADQGYGAAEVAYAVEKPWKFQSEYEQMKGFVDDEGPADDHGQARP